MLEQLDTHAEYKVETMIQEAKARYKKKKQLVHKINYKVLFSKYYLNFPSIME